MGEDYLHYDDVLDRRLSLVRTEEKLSKVVVSLFREPFEVNEESVCFAILGDLHGRMTIALDNLKDWVNYAGLPLDAILQVGDIGAIDNQSVLDKITAEIAEKDPDELGFKNYFYGSKEADVFFGENGFFSNTPFYFIDGNHDDASFLKRAYNKNNLQIGKYGNLRYLPSGELIVFNKGELDVSIASLGWNRVKGDVRKLSNQKIDVLLTHEPPNYNGKGGARDLADFVSEVKPKNVFFGHAHRTAAEQSELFDHKYGLRQVKLDKSGNVLSGSTGILEISSEGSFFFYLPEKF